MKIVVDRRKTYAKMIAVGNFSGGLLFGMD